MSNKDKIKKLRKYGKYGYIDGRRVLILPQGLSLLEDTQVLYNEYDERRLGRRTGLTINVV